MRIHSIAAMCTGLLLAVAVRRGGAQEKPLAVWAEFTGTGVSIRAIVSGSDCPAVTLDEKQTAMTVRQAPAAAFPVTTCELMAPAGTKFAMAGGTRLKLVPRKVKRIVIIGDTGCRLKGAEVQDCNDPRKWPFSSMANRAAEKHPDLVIHVGDYYYRETPCPVDMAGCSGSPHGDRWESWRADFFAPASALLTVAPWVFARGNHEQCGRGAEGWFRFLDAGSEPLTCPATSPGFVVQLKGLNLDVIDTADVNDRQLGRDRLAFYESQLSPSRAGGKSGQTWLVTHKPLWGYELTSAGQRLVEANPFLAAAANLMDSPGRPQLPAMNMVVAGHIHLFGALDFGGVLRPAQLIVGDGGTALEPADTRSGQRKIDGLMARYTVKDSFGYLVLDRKKKGWVGTLYSVEDTVLATCKQQGRHIECRPAGS